WDNRFIVLSMIISGFVLAVLLLIMTAFPFGDATVMRMDLYHQYGPLFCELYDRVTGFETFNYSWISGGGSPFIGNYFNYLSSPFSFIILLFDRKQMPYAITAIVAVKCLLSAAAFTYYLKSSLKRHSCASACFGVFYSFCAYFLAYYWNVMWLDGMMLFPLIILGIEKIIDNGKPLLDLVCLTVLLYSSYYMGYMTCIFAVVYFVCYYVLKHDLGETVNPNLVTEKKFALKQFTNNRLINSGLRFAGTSILAGLLCAVSLIPVYLILQNSSATSDSFPHSFELYHDLLNIITSHLGAVETTIRSSGDDVLPNIYCGVLSIIILPLYVANSKIRIKEKTVYIAILLFFVMSFNVNIANFIWHAFHFPNDLPYRFSFMYSFIFLVIAFRAFMHFKEYEYKDIALCGMFWMFMIVLIQKYMTNKMGTFTIYANIVFILMWTAYLLLLKNGKLTKTILSVFLVFLVFVEGVLACASNIPLKQRLSDYTENYDTYEEAIDNIYDNDDSFYRLELSELLTRMDSCLYGYRGMSTFSSMAYESYSGLQYSQGMYGNRINSYTYYPQTPIYNMFYSLKYIINSPGTLPLSTDYYEKTYTTKDEKSDVYKNKYFLPAAFTVSSDIKDAVVEEGDPFEVQSDILNKACGVTDIFKPVQYVETDSDDVDCEDIGENGTYYFTKSDPDSTYGTIDVTIKTVDDSNLYVYITSPKLENVNYYYDAQEDGVYQNIDTPYIMDLGKHKKGDEVKI
ncbi:MAG: YfhO family protein, partial [Eubacterium sp.]|nr:YfhO family protein [Eubacterium sp.]